MDNAFNTIGNDLLNLLCLTSCSVLSLAGVSLDDFRLGHFFLNLVMTHRKYSWQ